ncbi:MAG: AAA family ATPase, partial [Chitinivibrionales bacterium]|nr:AAA family ATPase [Chitinivibrionales bacterium]
SPQAKARVIEYLRTIYDGIDDFDTIVEGGTVQVFLQENSRSIPATRLSDGTLRYLCLLSILCHPAPPPLICIEEPELGMHPDILPSLAHLLIEASEKTQLIVTTHSDILVDALTQTPESIVVCEKPDSSSTLRRLDPKALKPWLEKYRLGELWTRGEIGGNRW